MSDLKKPAWLTAAVDQKLAYLEEKLPEGMWDLGQDLILCPLKEPPSDDPEDVDLWERQCDNCGRDCRGFDFYTGHVQMEVRGTKLVFMYGACSLCSGVEE